MLRRWNSTPFHLLALAGLSACYIAASWRRWPDPLIDFGKELYLPWRIAQGAVLYRDVDDVFGPLSQYINAALFALFGPGLMRLVWANLVVFGAILVTLYCLLRRAWGAGAALVASGVFVSVFGFSHFVFISNYTYAAPYAHETTHGLLVLLLLLAVLARWLTNPTRFLDFSAGILCGLTAVLKLEIMLAAILLSMTAAALRWRNVARPSAGCLVMWATGAVLPTLLFVGYFARHLPLGESWAAAGHVWLNASTRVALAKEPFVIGLLGLDHPWPQLIQHIQATCIAVIVIAMIVAFGKIADRQSNQMRSIAIGAVMMVAVSWIAWWKVSWFDIGRCLLGLILVYLVGQMAALVRDRSRCGDPALNLRVLFGVLAAALMARMVLNGRIYNYGYCQAAVAGTIVPAVLLGELSCWANVERWGRTAIIGGVLALLLPGVVILTAQSQHVWKLKTYVVGKGSDRFYTFPPKVEPTGEIVRVLTEFLSQQPRNHTLLVLPEGLMINYLSRLRSPLAPPIYFSVVTEHGGEAQLVDELQRQPPDLVVIISRDLREYGIQRYGEAPGRGQLLLRWVMANYRVMGSVGGDPLDFRQRGAVILQRDASK